MPFFTDLTKKRNFATIHLVTKCNNSVTFCLGITNAGKGKLYET